MTKTEIEAFLNNTSFTFFPSQNKICLPILNRMIRKMKVQLYFKPIKVNSNLIIDRHHRYIASKTTGQIISLDNYSKPSLLLKGNWAEIIIDENDWETPEEIIKWNYKDAAYNDITFKELVQKIK